MGDWQGQCRGIAARGVKKMKFCRICGAKIKNDGQICPKCGFHQNASIAQAVEAGEIKEKDWPESFVPKKSLMARRLAAAIVAIGSVALLLAGGYFISTGTL